MAQKKSGKKSAGTKKKNTKGTASAKNSRKNTSVKKTNRNSAASKSAQKGSSAAVKRPSAGNSPKTARSVSKKTAARQPAAAKNQQPAKTAPAVKQIRKKRSGKKIARNLILTAAAVFLAIVTGVYMKDAFYYKEHFFKGTVINGTDCSDLTASEAEQTIQNTLDQYTYTFTDHEGRSNTVTAPELSVTYSDDGEVDELLAEQEYLLWAFQDDENETYNVTSGYTYSQEALDSWTSDLPCLNDGVAPTDAYEAEKEDGYWEIIPETYGDLLDPEPVRQLIRGAVDEGRPASDLSEIDCFVQPAVRADDPELTASVEAKNAEVERQYIIEDITDAELMFSSYTDKVYLNQELLRGMIENDENGRPVISETMVEEWVENWAKERGFDKNPNLFVTHGGKLMCVDNGPYGGWSLDLKATASRVYEAVLNKEHDVLYPVTVDENGTLQSKSSYVEINIYKQTMWYYKEGKQLVETPIVTGDPTKDMDTPSNGVWDIYIKMTDYTLRGPIQADGLPEYATQVDYWMPFNGQIGIHDMQSREEFGGSIYKGGGSHGCVNTPLENVEVIFENAPVGTPVVVHS